MTLDRSVFIFGPGRSGTTIFFRMLACHRDFGWISNLNEAIPGIPQAAILSRLRGRLDFPGNRTGLAKYLPLPKEALSVPRHVTDGHFQSRQIIDESNLDEAAAASYRQYLSQLLKWQGKRRLLHKHTGFARTIFLSSVDPDSRFIRVIRDGRAVANSWMHVPWWDGTMNNW